jgi:glutathione S-transferase
MTPEEQDQFVRAELKRMASWVQSQLPPYWGFVLLAFPFGGEGRYNYISNAQRADIVRAMYEFITATKAKWGQDIPEGAAAEDAELGRLRQRVAELEQHIKNLGSFGVGEKQL